MGFVGARQADAESAEENPHAVDRGILAAARRRLQAPRRNLDPAGALGRQDGARRSLSFHGARAGRGARSRSRLAAARLLAAALARPGDLLLDDAGGFTPPHRVDARAALLRGRAG